MSLTIKQAFAALSDACAKGMKNPFFVMKRLKESFADVADKVVAGGSEVTVTPITDSGTKIATITVDSVDKDIYAPKAEVSQTVTEGTEIAEIDGTKIYAPSSGGLDYSTSEQDTGIKWIDGKEIYQKTIDLGVFERTVGQAAHAYYSITGIYRIIDYRIIGIKSGQSMLIPSVNYQSNLANVCAVVRTGDCEIYTDVYIDTYHGYLTLYYTKSS